MDMDMVVSLIACIGSAVGTFGGILVSNKLTNYRIAQLEKKVDMHNLVIDRTYKVEANIELLDQRQKVTEHRIQDLER